MEVTAGFFFQRKKRIRVKNKAASDGESDVSGSREGTQIVYHPK